MMELKAAHYLVKIEYYQLMKSKGNNWFAKNSYVIHFEELPTVSPLKLLNKLVSHPLIYFPPNLIRTYFLEIL